MLPTLYHSYTENGIISGLTENAHYFHLNNKSITILAGAMHYFRVPSQYWRDRLRKIRAAGLNTVETYVPWNLHEPEQGNYDFGHGGSDFQEFLNVEKFLRTAQEEDLLAIVRIGPYICAEMDFGGMPSWLLSYPDLKFRSSDHVFLYHVRKYFGALLSILTLLQFSYGGPIIGFQIENEFSEVARTNNTDKNYLEFLKWTLIDNGVVEMIFMADNPYGNITKVPGVLNVGTFGSYTKRSLRYLQVIAAGRPLMVMEYWIGWYDHWMLAHRTGYLNAITARLRDIFLNHASVNLYMFIGGTSYGFTNGATYRYQGNLFAYFPNTNSYDFDAPISESGDITEKYHILRNMIMEEYPPSTRVPKLLPGKPRIAYAPIRITEEIRLYDLLGDQKKYLSKYPIAMERLPVSQSYGYIVYRKTGLDIPALSELKITENVCDRAIVLINGESLSSPTSVTEDVYTFGHHNGMNQALTINQQYTNATLDILVENTGRVNFGISEIYPYQLKGIWIGHILLNNNIIKDFEIIPLEFKTAWTNNLTAWRKPTFAKGPALYKAVLAIDEPRDTFIDMRSWYYGIVIVNGFVLSRYLRLGPIQTVFLPAPLLKVGDNQIVVFELFEPYKFVRFTLEHRYARSGPCNLPIPLPSQCMISLPYRRSFNLFMVLCIYWFC